MMKSVVHGCNWIKRDQNIASVCLLTNEEIFINTLVDGYMAEKKLIAWMHDGSIPK